MTLSLRKWGREGIGFRRKKFRLKSSPENCTGELSRFFYEMGQQRFVALRSPVLLCEILRDKIWFSQILKEKYRSPIFLREMRSTLRCPPPRRGKGTEDRPPRTGRDQSEGASPNRGGSPEQNGPPHDSRIKDPQVQGLRREQGRKAQNMRHKRDPSLFPK